MGQALKGVHSPETQFSHAPPSYPAYYFKLRALTRSLAEQGPAPECPQTNPTMFQASGRREELSKP